MIELLCLPVGWAMIQNGLLAYGTALLWLITFGAFPFGLWRMALLRKPAIQEAFASLPD